MKLGLICYYSQSGITKKAVSHLAKKIQGAKFEFFDIASGAAPSLDRYDIIGFATTTEGGDLPEHITSFFAHLDPHEGKDAFLLNIGGSKYGHTLFAFAALAKGKGFRIVSGYSLNAMPTGKPDKDEIGWFNNFIDNLSSFLNPAAA